MENVYDDFVKVDSAPVYAGSQEGSTIKFYLLWGDGVRLIENVDENNARVKVRARGKSGWVATNDLGGKSLLEFYFIDVGQGDGILIKTPNFRHIMIDGGNVRQSQDTKKNAADFVDWKFYKDYGMASIELDAMLASHCDYDHYGGLADLLDINQIDEMDAKKTTVNHFYHAGLSHWDDNGKDSLGDYVDVGSKSYWTQLLGDRADAVASTNNTGPELYRTWRSFITAVIQAKNIDGDPTSITRLSNLTDYLPGYEQGNPGEPAIKILGPVEFNINGGPALRRFKSGNKSQNTNGVSLLIRIDFGNTRTILTGDLNQESQKALLADYVNQTGELNCDVVKACHHGSDDVSYLFLQQLNAAATVISSGDNENYDHPRPSIIAASATTGYFQMDGNKDRILTPLVYSTELARSIDLGTTIKIELKDENGNIANTIESTQLYNANFHLIGCSKKVVPYNPKVVGNLIYGLVNVRTDGKKILCATLDEKSKSWKIKKFRGRF